MSQDDATPDENKPNTTVQLRYRWNELLTLEGVTNIDLADYPAVWKAIQDNPGLLEDGVVELLESSGVPLTAFDTEVIVRQIPVEHSAIAPGAKERFVPEFYDIKIPVWVWRKVFVPWDMAHNNCSNLSTDNTDSSEEG